MATVANVEVIKRLVILIAEGKLHSRVLLRSMLLLLEVKKIYDVIDGAAVLDAINAVSPDVMILDWDLPVLSAREILRVVRTSNATSNPNLPIILISSSGQSEYVHDAIKLGTPHFMVWPISPKMLELRLHSIVTDARKTARSYKHRVPTPRLGAQLL